MQRPSFVVPHLRDACVISAPPPSASTPCIDVSCMPRYPVPEVADDRCDDQRATGAHLTHETPGLIVDNVSASNNHVFTLYITSSFVSGHA